MAKQHGPWTILKRNPIYQDPWIRVEQDDVLRPDGCPGSYSVVHLKPGVCVLAVDSRGVAHLTREFHYGVGRVTLEAVSGGIDSGEDALVTAKRELAEELGLTARTWESLGVVDPFTGSVVSPTALFLARDLTRGVPRPEGTEQIEAVELDLRAAVQRVLRSQITHAPTCAALMRAGLKLGVLQLS